MNETRASSFQSISHESISRRAEEIWRSYGTPSGRDEEIWLEAESQLRTEHQQSLVPQSENVATKDAPPAAQNAAHSPTVPAKSSAKASELMENKANPTPSKPKSRSSKSR